jgi:hypothetical protein
MRGLVLNIEVSVVVETPQVLPAQWGAVSIQYRCRDIMNIKGGSISQDDNLESRGNKEEGVELFIPAHLFQFFYGGADNST